MPRADSIATLAPPPQPDARFSTRFTSRIMRRKSSIFGPWSASSLRPMRGALRGPCDSICGVTSGSRQSLLEDGPRSLRRSFENGCSQLFGLFEWWLLLLMVVFDYCMDWGVIVLVGFVQVLDWSFFFCLNLKDL